MALCDMCGKDTRLLRTEIESSELNVCKDCSKYGKILGARRNRVPGRFAKVQREEKNFLIVDNYDQLIKNAREKLGLKQEDVAKKIAERESVIHTFESKHRKPSMNVARKLEKFLHIKLVEEQTEPEDANETFEPKKKSAFTLGDFVKVRKR